MSNGGAFEVQQSRREVHVKSRAAVPTGKGEVMARAQLLTLSLAVCLSLGPGRTGSATSQGAWAAGALTPTARGNDAAAVEDVSCSPPPSGMIAWWPGDGNANDISGSGLNGTPMDGVSFVPGKVGPAFQFNGVDGKVEIADSPVLRFGIGDLTVDAWIKVGPGSNFQTFVGKEQQSFPFPSLDFRITDQGLLQFLVTDCGTGACGFSNPGGGGSRQPVESPFRVDDNVFHHVAGVRISSGYQLYVDGQLVATRLEPARNSDSSTPLFIGIQSISTLGHEIFPFSGIVDEVEIFNRALSASEIQAIFNAGSAGKCKNRPPVAICANVMVSAGPSCTASASINNGSFDPDAGDTITLSQSPAGPYPLGATPVTLTVTDNHGASSQCSATVTVIDRTPPTISSLTVNPNTVWPPNHKMVPVTVTAAASDNCGTISCEIVSVTSNEPPGSDAIVSGDALITGSLSLNLRAERSGTGTGRIYTITVQCQDGSGNSSTSTVTVSVPHDQGR
jgi:hypothetical protein